MEDNRNDPSPQQGGTSGGSHQAEKNETLKDADTVPDYGRTSGQAEAQEGTGSGQQGGRQGNSSIPMDEEDEGPDAP